MSAIVSNDTGREAIATRYKLTWRKDGRWQKFYRGRRYYFPLHEGETKASSYQRVLREREELRAQIDGGNSKARHVEARERWQPLLNAVRESQGKVLETYGDTDETRAIWQDLEQTFVQGVILPAMKDGEPPAATEQGSLEEWIGERTETLQSLHWQPRIGFAEKGKEVSRPSPPAGAPPWEAEAESEGLRELLDAFIESVKAGATERRAENIRKNARRYLHQLPSGAGIEAAFVDRTLGEYFDRVKVAKNSKTGKALSDSTKRDRIRDVTQFGRWAYNRGYLDELPRILAPNGYRVEVSPGEIDTYSVTEVSEILSAAEGKARLYILLALNCAFTQVDISDLRYTETNLNAGTITRKR